VWSRLSLRSSNLQSSFQISNTTMVSTGKTTGLEDKYHCSISQEVADQFGKKPGSHVRVENGPIKAYAVVEEMHDGSVGFKTGSDGWERILSSPGDDVELYGTVPTGDYVEAWMEGGLAETLWESSEDKVLISCPHGGAAEVNTDVMGAHCAKMLMGSGVPVTTWMCHGFESYYDRKDSYSRWHLKKPVEAVDAYPQLQKIIDRRFDCVVGFHLQSIKKHSNLVMVGGQASDDLRKLVAESLQDALGGYADVAWRYSEFRLTGRGDLNSINYFAKDGQGIQIEMPPKVCRNKFKTVPRAVKNVLLDHF